MEPSSDPNIQSGFHSNSPQQRARMVARQLQTNKMGAQFGEPQSSHLTLVRGARERRQERLDRRPFPFERRGNQPISDTEEEPAELRNSNKVRSIEKNQQIQDKIQTVFEKRNRLDFTTVLLMLGTALLFDTIQAEISIIPFIGWILSSMLSGMAWLTFYMWTSLKGWGLSDTVKKVIVMWALPAIEFIPLVNVLPAWTLSVSLQLAFLKAEDTAYNLSRGKIDIEQLAGQQRKYIDALYKERGYSLKKAS